MPLQLDWPTKVITVPLSELTFVSGTRYTITVDYWFQLLREANYTEEGIVFDTMYSNIPPTTSTPRIVEVINGYTAQFENGLYSVEFINGNTNYRDIEIKNNVSVGTNNTTGFIDPKFLEAGLFQGAIAFDTVNGYAGTDKTPDGGIIGTRQTPSNNWADAKVIADDNGIHSFQILRNTTVAIEDFSDGHTFIGDSPTILLTLEPSANVAGCSLYNLTVTGELDGLNTVRNCSLMAVTNCSGFFEKCAFSSTFTISGTIALFECYSQVTGAGYPTVSNGNNTIQLRDWHGSLGVSGMTGGTHTLEIYGGQLHLDNTCTGGNVYMRGEHSSIVDDQSTGTNVINQTATEATWADNKALTVPKFLGLK